MQEMCCCHHQFFSIFTLVSGKRYLKNYFIKFSSRCFSNNFTDFVFILPDSKKKGSGYPSPSIYLNPSTNFLKFMLWNPFTKTQKNFAINRKYYYNWTITTNMEFMWYEKDVLWNSFQVKYRHRIGQNIAKRWVWIRLI